jgi:hypothetical protein
MTHVLQAKTAVNLMADILVAIQIKFVRIIFVFSLMYHLAFENKNYVLKMPILLKRIASLNSHYACALKLIKNNILYIEKQIARHEYCASANVI